jgi:hypothetical protein
MTHGFTALIMKVCFPLKFNICISITKFLPPTSLGTVKVEVLLKKCGLINYLYTRKKLLLLMTKLNDTDHIDNEDMFSIKAQYLYLYKKNSFPQLLLVRLKWKYWKKCGLIGLRQRLWCFHGKHYLEGNFSHPPVCFFTPMLPFMPLKKSSVYACRTFSPPELFF